MYCTVIMYGRRNCIGYCVDYNLNCVFPNSIENRSVYYDLSNFEYNNALKRYI